MLKVPCRLDDIYVQNPIVEFKNREKYGDFDPVKPDEDPNALAVGREPLTDVEFEKMKSSVLRVARFFGGEVELDLNTLLCRLISAAELAYSGEVAIGCSSMSLARSLSARPGTNDALTVNV